MGLGFGAWVVGVTAKALLGSLLFSGLTGELEMRRAFLVVREGAV